MSEICMWREPHYREPDYRNPDGCGWRGLHRFEPAAEPAPQSDQERR